jgi:hypothetical protein
MDEAQLFFSSLPGLNGMFMACDYESIDSEQKAVEIAYKWLNEFETSANEVRKQNYFVGFHWLYSKITNRSYDTKKFESC